jgi:hypothetical protein
VGAISLANGMSPTQKVGEILLVEDGVLNSILHQLGRSYFYHVGPPFTLARRGKGGLSPHTNFMPL